MLERQYEIMFLLNVNEHEQTQEEVRQIILQHGGHILKEDKLGLREIAYPIKKQTKGFYCVMYVDFPVENFQAFQSAVRLKEGILRHLSLIVKKKNYIRRGKKKVAVVDGKVKSSQSNKTKEISAVNPIVKTHKTHKDSSEGLVDNNKSL